MPYIDENVFNDQMRSLLVARGGYTSEKKKEEIKRYWYIEFRDCDERAFIRVMEQLKFEGKSGEGFPGFRDFRERYNILIRPMDRLEGREYCGFCRVGRVFYRDTHPDTGEVHDYVADCAQCTPKERGEFAKVNPRELHKDRTGQLRTVKALARDRKKIEIKRPPWIYAKFPKLKDEKVYFQGLKAADDPDVELVYQVPVQKPSNGLEKSLRGDEISKAIFGKSDPKTEARREASLQNAKEEEFGNVPY